MRLHLLRLQSTITSFIDAHLPIVVIYRICTSLAEVYLICTSYNQIDCLRLQSPITYQQRTKISRFARCLISNYKDLFALSLISLSKKENKRYPVNLLGHAITRPFIFVCRNRLDPNEYAWLGERIICLFPLPS